MDGSAVRKAIEREADRQSMPLEQYKAHLARWAEFDRMVVDFMGACGVEVRGMYQTAQAAGDGQRVRAALSPDYAPGPSSTRAQAVERRKLTALKNEVRGRWPTVDRDFRDAHENDLKAAAKLPEHGYWDLDAALRWAHERGKLIDPAPQEVYPLEAFNRRPRRR